MSKTSSKTKVVHTALIDKSKKNADLVMAGAETEQNSTQATVHDYWEPPAGVLVWVQEAERKDQEEGRGRGRRAWMEAAIQSLHSFSIQTFQPPLRPPARLPPKAPAEAAQAVMDSSAQTRQRVCTRRATCRDSLQSTATVILEPTICIAVLIMIG